MQLHENPKKEPVIIILGGSFGSGKSTLTNRLNSRLKIIRHIELGPIIETLKIHPKWRALASRLNFWDLHPEFYLNYSELLSIAKPINQVVRALIERSYKFGTDTLIEGVELFPSFLGLKHVTLWVYLAAPDKTIHYSRLNCPRTHFKRRINKMIFNHIRDIDHILQTECEQFGIPVLQSAPLNILEEQVFELLSRAHN